MSSVFLLTGSPGTGKTTIIRETLDVLSVKSGGFYTGDFDGDISSGLYDITVFHQEGATPQANDEIITGLRMFWSGSGVLTAEKLLACRAAQDKLSGQITYYDHDGQTPILLLEPSEDAGSISRIPI